MLSLTGINFPATILRYRIGFAFCGKLALFASGTKLTSRTLGKHLYFCIPHSVIKQHQKNQIAFHNHWYCWQKYENVTHFFTEILIHLFLKVLIFYAAYYLLHVYKPTIGSANTVAFNTGYKL